MKKMLFVFAAVLFFGSMSALPATAERVTQEDGFTALHQILAANEAVE